MKLGKFIKNVATEAIATGIVAKDMIREHNEEKREEKKREEERKKQEEAKKRKKILKWAIPVACVLMLSMVGLAFSEDPEANPNPNDQQDSGKVENNIDQGETASIDQGELKVSFLDVGQGDSIFIELPNNETMLIDAGTAGYGDDVVRYIQTEGYDKIDYLVATHPHDDHIGGMAQVLTSLDVEAVYMPKVSHTTYAFENLLDVISDEGLKISTAKSNVTILDEGDLWIGILAPVGETYSDLNNYSAVIKIVYGENSFLLMGDAEKLSESEITGDVSADVLKVGHHGSDYSSGQTFIRAVAPTYAVISVGEGNQYGHPSYDTVNLLKALGIKVYRTDLDGTVVFTSDGDSIKVDKTPTMTSEVTEPSDNEDTTPDQTVDPPTNQNTTPQKSDNDIIVYRTESGVKYHNDGCRSLYHSRIALTLAAAKGLGLTPCSICHPPQ